MFLSSLYLHLIIPIAFYFAIEYENVASITTETNRVYIANFTNVARETGSITIAKEIQHSLGTEYVIPDLEFNIIATLEGIAINNGDKFAVEHSGNSELTAVEVKDSKVVFTLKHNQSVVIKDLPEGTKVTVTEEDPGAEFTASYLENGQSGDGIITVVKNPTNSIIEVVNTYEPKPVDVKINLSGNKTLKDQDDNTIDPQNWNEDLEFSFIIQKYVEKNGVWKWVNTETVDVASKKDGNSIDFLNDGTTLTFDKVGVYGYQVIEANHGLTIDGVTYDGTMHTFSVVVTDKDMDGALEAEVISNHTGKKFDLVDDVWTNDNIDFVNTISQGHTSATVMIKKNLVNDSGSTLVDLSGYKFALYHTDENYNIDGASPVITDPTDATGETYASMEFDYKNYTHLIDNTITEATATEYFLLKEVNTGIAGMKYSELEYKIQVVLTINNDGTITAKIASDGDPAFGEFQSAVQGVVYPLATFENVYEVKSVNVPFTAQKNLTGKNLSEGEFTFEAYALTPNAPLPEKSIVTNDAGGKIDFGEVLFTKTGEYRYVIKEINEAKENYIYDHTEYQVHITVTDKGGELIASTAIMNSSHNDIIFNNQYIPSPVKVKLSGNKELRGGLSMVNDQFTFHLVACDESGNEVENGKHLIATNDINGIINFSDITYTIDDYNTAKIYRYKVYEEIPEATHGVAYDSKIYSVIHQLNYDADMGVLSVDEFIDGGLENSIIFVNEYKPAPTTLTINGVKDLQNKKLEKDQFTFELYNSDSEWSVREKPYITVKNDQEGKFIFAFSEGYFKVVGEHYYVIKEVGSGSVINGITYDSKMVGVKITVTDDLRGALVATPEYFDIVEQNGDSVATLAGAVVFINQYNVTGEAKVVLNGNKTLNGRDLADGEFEFILKNVTDGDNIVDVTTVKNGADGQFNIVLTYDNTNIGNTYKYTLSEKIGTLNNIKYDDRVYKIAVDVFDNGDGTVGTKVTMKEDKLIDKKVDSLDFVNDYVSEDSEEMPDTGDRSNIIMWFMILIVSATCLITFCRKRVR